MCIVWGPARARPLASFTALFEHAPVDTTSLGEDLRSIVDHAEALLKALADDGDPRLDALRERVCGSIDTARERLAEFDREADRPGDRVAAAVQRWIRENPWTAIAIGASVGLVIGVLLSGPPRQARADVGAP